jgi:hypothetical protein
VENGGAIWIKVSPAMSHECTETVRLPYFSSTCTLCFTPELKIFSVQKKQQKFLLFSYDGVAPAVTHIDMCPGSKEHQV